MRRAGQIVAEVLDTMREQVAPGVTTAMLILPNMLVAFGLARR